MGEVLSDKWHQTLEEAKEQAEFEYTALPGVAQIVGFKNYCMCCEISNLDVMTSCNQPFQILLNAIISVTIKPILFNRA
jgi:hypothetical protein